MMKVATASRLWTASCRAVFGRISVEHKRMAVSSAFVLIFNLGDKVGGFSLGMFPP